MEPGRYGAAGSDDITQGACIVRAKHP